MKRLRIPSLVGTLLFTVVFLLMSTGITSAAGWTIVPGANRADSINQLDGVIAISSSDVWAVGFFIKGDNPRHTLIEHWTGSSWNIVASLNKGTGDNVLNAVTKVPGTTQAWTVGSYVKVLFGGPQLTLIEHYA